jgi:hypothetical protein
MTHDDGGDGDAGGDFWFNPTTGEVEEGKVSSWTHRMGPFPTREAAQRALATVAERNKAWEDEDRRWNG